MLHKAWNSKGEMPYCFPRSSIKFQGHTVQNITDFDPNWAFPDCRPVAAFKSLRFALLSLHCRMEGPTDRVQELSPTWRNSGQEPCIPQVLLQDIPEPLGTCPLPGVVVMMEPPSVHVGPSGSVLGPMFTTSQGPQLLQSSVKDPLLLILHPPRSSIRVSCGHAVCSLFRGTQCHRSHRASGLWSCPRLMERQSLSPLPVPFLTFDACPGIGPHISALSAPPRLRMPLPRHPYIPPPSAWQWPGHDVGSSPVSGQPAQLAPPPGPSAPTTGFPDMVGWPSTVLLPQFQAVVLGTRPSSSPTPIVSAASMPRLRSPGSRPAHVDVRHRMDFTQMSGGPRPLPPAQGFPLPFSISCVIAFHWTSSHAGLRSASDHGETDVTAASTGEGRSPGGFVSSQVHSGPIAGHAIHSGHYAGHIPAAGEGPARCSSTLAVARSLCPDVHGLRRAAATQSCLRPKGVKGWA